MPATAHVSRSRLAQPALLRLRTQLGLSQEAVAHVLGVSARTVIRWESRAASPSRLAQERIDRLAEVTRLAEQIFSGTGVAAWFGAPNPALGGRAPAEVLGLRGGLDEVYHLLGRMAWGIPT